MKTSFPTLPSLAALFAAALFAVAAAAQAPQAAPPQQPAAAPPPDEHERVHPAPTNLKVLPKNLTGDQVHEIMEGWEAALGAHCSTCHAADPKNIGPNGRPRLNYADDSRPEKSTARIMYTMVQDINENYISMVENSGRAGNLRHLPSRPHRPRAVCRAKGRAYRGSVAAERAVLRRRPPSAKITGCEQLVALRGHGFSHE